MKVEISENIKYIGVDDKEIDLFESQYIVPNGISYNSYVILGDKVAVMDTVDERFAQQWLNNLKDELGTKAPDYLVVEHLEPDHAGSIGIFCDEYPDTKIVCSAKAKAMLPQFFDIDESRVIAVGEGESLDLGSHKLTFVMAPMVHWPEVMVAYESTEKVLFSADGFGKFGALDTDEDWACEARRYYFNIVGKYGGPVQTLLKKASALDIKTICPLHGPILTDTIPEVLRLYNLWSSYQPESEGIFIAHASIHGSTAKAAAELKAMLEARGVKKVAIADLCREDLAECVEDAFRYPTTVLMASSYDGGVFTPMSDFLHRLSAKAYQNRTVALVENFSWAATANRVMRSELEKMKNITIAENTVSIKTKLNQQSRESLEKLADEISGR